MFFRYLTLLIFTTFSTYLNAQNLVPNPSFEEYDCIPTDINQLHCTKYWYNANNRTPDYFTVLATRASPAYTINVWGAQSPKTGDAYIALHTWTSEQEEIEYVQVKLSDTLTVGTEYNISYWIAFAANSDVASNAQGLLLTTDSFQTTGFILRQPQVYNPSILSASDNWYLIKETFVADKPYRYLTLGNFFGTNPPFERKDLTNIQRRATYYWDDIAIEPTGKKLNIDFTLEEECFPLQYSFTAGDLENVDQWEWIFSDSIKLQGQQITRSFQQNGTYSVTLKATRGNKTFSILKQIVVNQPLAPIANFNLTSEPIGIEQSITFQNNSQHSTNFSWNFGDGKTSNENNPIHTYEDTGTYLVSLIVSNANGCADTIQKKITILCNPKLVADFEIDSEHNTIEQEVIFNNVSQSATAYFWDFGDGNFSEEANPTYIYEKPGTYFITLTATSNDGRCVDTTSQSINVYCNSKLLANTFTPNGDGQNEVFPFEVFAECGDFKVQIYSRWGILVYESNNPLEPWNGAGANPGTYFYKISFKGGVASGYIELIK